MSHSWIPTTVHGGLPPNAVYAGNDVDGSSIYLGRARFEDNLLPAKVIPSKQAAYVAHAGGEHFVENIEILVGHGFSWSPSSNGAIPEGAVISGSDSNGEPLYIGRAHHEGTLTPGKVHPSHGCLYIPYAGTEISVPEYEVLVGAIRTSWSVSSAFSPLPAEAFLAGHDIDGSPIYIGKTFHDGDYVPAKVLPHKQVAYIPHGGEEITLHQYEILCNGNNTAWVHSGHGAISPRAVVGGRSASGEPFYIGRVEIDGSRTPGKVHPSHQKLYVAFNGTEMSFDNYELLIEH